MGDSDAIARAQGILRRLSRDPLEAVSQLTEARKAIDEALNEAMAEAALEGVPMRAVALAAEVAPNSVPPRLARSPLLAPYAFEGKVSSESIVRARYDSEAKRDPEEALPAKPKMTFTRRRPTSLAKDGRNGR